MGLTSPEASSCLQHTLCQQYKALQHSSDLQAGGRGWRGPRNYLCLLLRCTQAHSNPHQTTRALPQELHKPSCVLHTLQTNSPSFPVAHQHPSSITSITSPSPFMPGNFLSIRTADCFPSSFSFLMALPV